MTSFEDNHPGLKGKVSCENPAHKKDKEIICDRCTIHPDDVDATQTDKTVVLEVLNRHNCPDECMGVGNGGWKCTACRIKEELGL